MNTYPQLYLVCYDICGPKRLREVYKTMRGYGDHLQYSVFRCALSPVQLARMKADLTRSIEPSEDQVLIVPLGVPHRAEQRMETLGVPLIHPERIVRIF
ncbi:MAG: CRISPR-associated endonuclease Cas2 [Deltaproteobacteria bacterium]|nr:CRISPR-associated endonuclease Cas2 [Deltaproteobacteria bacterium]